MRAWDPRVTVAEVVKAFEAGLLDHDRAVDAVISILEFDGLIPVRDWVPEGIKTDGS
jgi:hypothetical protein